MYSRSQISNFISLDIETTAGYANLKDLEKANPRLGMLWRKRCIYLRNKHADNLKLSDEEIYNTKAGLQAEFGKIVCISIAFARFTGESEPATIKTKSFANDDELIVLKQFIQFINKMETDLPNAVLVGHNVMNFDFPFIFKRCLINKIKVPKSLNLNGKKPWEINVVDTAKLFSNGAWNESFVSLDIMTACLGIPTPKDVIDGSEVNAAYWNDGRLEEIKEYCQKDTVAVLNFLLEISGESYVDVNNVIYT